MRNSSAIDFKILLAEALATFVLILVGTGAIVLDHEGIVPFGNFGIALCFGVVVALMILAFGKISGAHMNPVVTFYFFLEKKFPKEGLIPYFLAQALGAFAASILLRVSFPEDEFLGATLPKSDVLFVLITEVVLTYLLLKVIDAFEHTSPKRKVLAPYLIGFIIFIEAFGCGRISGASMNPIRSLAPALVSGHVEYFWLYILAPFLAVYVLKLEKRFRF